MIFGLKEEARLRIMVALAKLYPEIRNRPELARDLGISLGYLELLTVDLIKAGLVSSVRGKHGGIWLATDPQNITLFDIMNVEPRGNFVQELKAYEKKWASFLKAHSLSEII